MSHPTTPTPIKSFGFNTGRVYTSLKQPISVAIYDNLLVHFKDYGRGIEGWIEPVEGEAIAIDRITPRYVMDAYDKGNYANWYATIERPTNHPHQVTPEYFPMLRL